MVERSLLQVKQSQKYYSLQSCYLIVKLSFNNSLNLHFDHCTAIIITVQSDIAAQLLYLKVCTLLCMSCSNYLNYKSSNYLHNFSNNHYCKYIGLSNTSSTMLHLSITSNQIDIQRKLRSKIYHTHISCNLLDITNNHYPPDKILSDNYVMCKLSLDSLTYILLHTSYKNLMMNNLYIRPNTKYNHYSFRMSQLDN